MTRPQPWSHVPELEYDAPKDRLMLLVSNQTVPEDVECPTSNAQNSRLIIALEEALYSMDVIGCSMAALDFSRSLTTS